MIVGFVVLLVIVVLLNRQDWHAVRLGVFVERERERAEDFDFDDGDADENDDVQRPIRRSYPERDDV